MMIANYHCHTYRCGHAEGDEREYVERAVERGLKILGFSDHTPYDFFDCGPRNRPMRMKPEELPGYADSIRSLADEYRGRLEILLGVEAEYYPKYFSRLLEMLRESRVSYMILGQHYLNNEVDGGYSGRATDDASRLERYVAQTKEAIETGLFTYFAHPDLINYTGDSAIYRREMRKLCEAANKAKMPMEINLLGMRDGRHYPNERFWELAAEEGCEVILGSDAHQPEFVTDPASEEKALTLVEKLGLRLVSKVELKKI